MKKWNLAGAAVLAAACALLSAGAILADETAPAHTPASWQKHQYSFAYLGFTSTYSCDGLADKLRKLLLAAGARPDAKSQPGACASGFGRPDKFARADLTFHTLTPADGATDGKTVNGVWRPVAIANLSPREIALGDCELIEQFRNQVLPMFTTRNVVSNMTCIPHQESGSTIDLRFESFAALPSKKQATGGN
jgi:hypothetical protein